MQARASLITPAFVALSLAELAYFTGVGALIALVPLFADGVLGSGTAGVGLAVGSFSISALVLRPWAGRAVDRWGVRRLLVLGAGLFALLVSAHLLITSLWALVALRVGLGVAEAVFFVAGMAALADIAPADRLGEALSYNSLSLYVGITAGPALGELLLDRGGYDLAWLGVAAIGAGAGLMALALPKDRPRSPATARVALIPARLVAPGLAFVAGLAASAGFLGFAALHARDLGMSGAAVPLVVYGAVVVVGRIGFARFTDRGSAERLSRLALLLVAIALATIAVVQHPAGLVAGAAILGLGVTFLTPAFFRVLMERMPAENRGAGAATFSIMVDLGLGGGPMLYGAAAAGLGIPGAFALAAGLTLAALTLIRPGRRPRADAA